MARSVPALMPRNNHKKPTLVTLRNESGLLAVHDRAIATGMCPSVGATHGRSTLFDRIGGDCNEFLNLIIKRVKLHSKARHSLGSALRSEKVRKLFGEEDLELLEDLEHAGRCADAVRHLTCAILDRCRLKLSVVLQKSSDVPMDPSVVPSAPVARPSVPGADAPSVSSARKRNRRKKKKTVDDGDEGTGTLVDTPMAAVVEIFDEWADSDSSWAHPSASSLAGAIVAVQPVSQMSSNSVMASRPPREIYRNPSDEASQPTPRSPRAELRVGMHVEVTAINPRKGDAPFARDAFLGRVGELLDARKMVARSF